MLLFSIITDSAFQHDPSVKIDIGRFFRHCEVQDIIILLRLIQRIDRIPGPLVVGNDFTCDHIRLTGVGLKRISVVLHILQIILNSLNRLGRDIVHLLLKALLIVWIRAELRTCQKIML